MAAVEVLATGEKFLKHGLRGAGPVIEDLISDATNEIHMLAYVVTPHARRIVDLLEVALERGVKVTVVINKLAAQSPTVVSRLNRLSKAHKYFIVADFDTPKADLHAKVVVADRKRAVVGSANFSFGGMTKNYEVGVRFEGREAWKLSKLIDSLSGA